MVTFLVSEKDYKEKNLLYAQSNLLKLAGCSGFKLKCGILGSRSILNLSCPRYYADIVASELKDKLAEIVAINYKYDFFKKNVKVSGLNKNENEILMASLIAADLEDDKRYVYEKLRGLNDFALDGVYNFRLQPLKKKWEDIVSYMPSCFINNQLKDFVRFLLENRKSKSYIENGAVYDGHYRKLNRAQLLDGENLLLLKEIILSNCGEVSIKGDIPKDDEFYIKEFYGDKIEFSDKYYH